MKNKITFTNKEKKMVLFTPDKIDILKEYFKLNNDAKLVIDFSELIFYKKPINFNILKDFNLKRLLILGFAFWQPRHDISYLMQIKTLIELDDRYSKLNYDFFKYPNLEILRYGWNSKSKNLNYYNKLKELSLWEYKPKTKDLSGFNLYTNLIELRLLQSNIHSINGISALNNIKELAFVYNKFLKLKDIKFTLKSVENLYIENCKGISLQDIIKVFPNVKYLAFKSNGVIESVEPFIKKMKCLKYLDVSGTKVKKKKHLDNIEIIY